MDLIRAIRAAREVRGLAADLYASSGLEPDWSLDEAAFFTHFGVAHEEYLEVVSRLTREQSRLLEATLAVNPEAAVLWVLSMEEVG